MSISYQFTVHSPWRTVDKTDEADSTVFETCYARVRAGDARSENDSIVSEIEDNEQSHLHSAQPHRAHHSDITSTDLVRPQLFAKVGGNGKWEIHGIIGKEVIEGKVYYYMDWKLMMMSLSELSGAECLVEEFETKE